MWLSRALGKQKTHLTHFIVTPALLQRSGTKPAVSPRRTCILKVVRESLSDEMTFGQRPPKISRQAGKLSEGRHPGREYSPSRGLRAAGRSVEAV